MVVSQQWFEFYPFNLYLTPCLPEIYHIFTSFNLDLTSASSGITNHGLESPVYRSNFFPATKVTL